ncbi:hypothetical protein C5167_028507 [Papaver somniferum]|nr:hypothetical protein C5167_028507 [Papaver somniferum]
MEKAEITKDEWGQINKGRAEWANRERLRNEALHQYSKQNPVVVKSFVSDIENLKEGESLYVFCFAYAKIQSTKYKEFFGLSRRQFQQVVYIGCNTDLSMALMLSETSELKPGLRRISSVLSSRDDVGVLVTNKTEDQILRKGKFRAYEEFDFAKPGNTPSETLTYAEGAVLRLPTNISAEKLFPILQELEMPVKLTNDGRVIEMTQAYTVVKKKCANISTRRCSIIPFYQFAAGLSPLNNLDIIMNIIMVVLPDLLEGNWGFLRRFGDK